jgi:hypothetical protein
MVEDFWQVQPPDSPLFPDALWSQPENRHQSGKMAIVGGNAHGFAAVATAYQTALEAGVGQVKVILPNALKKNLPPVVTLNDVIFAPTNQSGGFSRQSLSQLTAAGESFDMLLFIGDSGANSETAGLLETFLSQNQTTPVVLTRDAVDLIRPAAEQILNRPRTHLVVSLSQLQKLLRTVYYPRILTFSQPAQQIAETLHKITTTFPSTITLWQANNLFVASAGRVVSQKFLAPLKVWNGQIATFEAAWQIWQSDIIQAASTSWLQVSKK